MWFRNIVIFPQTTIIPYLDFCMATFHFIWIIRIWIRLKEKRYSIQSKSKKIQLSDRIGHEIRILYTSDVNEPEQNRTISLLRHLYRNRSLLCKQPALAVNSKRAKKGLQCSMVTVATSGTCDVLTSDLMFWEKFLMPSLERVVETNALPHYSTSMIWTSGKRGSSLFDAQIDNRSCLNIFVNIWELSTQYSPKIFVVVSRFYILITQCHWCQMGWWLCFLHCFLT